METYHVPFPSLKTMAPQIFFFFFFEDFFHFVGTSSFSIPFSLVTVFMFTQITNPLYTAHQALHTGVLYKHIHKIHHKYSAPFGLAAEYAHPAEVFILGTGTILGPLLYCFFTQNLHIVTVYAWIVLRLFQAIDAHSGYGAFLFFYYYHLSLLKTNLIIKDFPWSLHNIVPFWSGAEHHDFHHMAFTNNFSTSFRWWDRIFGTDTKYREYRARVEASKKAMKRAGVGEKERAEMERKLMREVEEEGIRAEKEAEERGVLGGKTKAKVQ